MKFLILALMSATLGSTAWAVADAVEGTELVIECLENVQPWPIKVVVGLTERFPAPRSPHPNFRVKYIRTSYVNGEDERVYQETGVNMPPPGFIYLTGKRKPAPDYPRLEEWVSLTIPRSRDLEQISLQRRHYLVGTQHALEIRGFDLRCTKNF